MKKNSFLKVSGLLMMIFILSVSCRQKQDTVAIIHVRDVANQPVSGATVTLSASSSTGNPGQIDEDIKRTTNTNSAGEARFLYNDVYQLGQAGVGIFDVDVYFENMQGAGIIKVEQETTSEETVYIQ